jgi:hypothetical protein
MEKTKLPWVLYHEVFRKEISNMNVIEVQDSNGKAIIKWTGFDGADQPKKEKLANARFIVTACNNYDRLKAEKAELVDALKEVVRISDRKHDAWDKAKDVIAKVQP